MTPLSYHASDLSLIALETMRTLMLILDALFNDNLSHFVLVIMWFRVQLTINLTRGNYGAS